MDKNKKINSGESVTFPDSEKKVMKNNLEEVFNKALFEILPFNKEDDNLTRTPHRVAKMWVYEIFGGCFENKPNCTSFENTRNIDQIVTLGPMKMRSMCAHHFMPFIGDVYFSYKIDKNLIGASKPERMLDWVSRRPNTQEFLISKFLDEMEDVLGHNNIMAVAINVEHTCMTHRGILAHETNMFNVDIRGIFKEDPDSKKEVMDTIKMSQGGNK